MMTVGDVLGSIATCKETRRLRVTFAKWAPGMGPKDDTVTEEGDVYFYGGGTWILRGTPSNRFRSFRLFEVRAVEAV